MLATLFFSQGTPMLLGGDEFGNSQTGNNNAYAQDNEIGWVDWSGLESDPEFNASVRTVIRLRRKISLLRQHTYLHGQRANRDGWPNVAWLRPDGTAMQASDWPDVKAFAAVVASTSGLEQPTAVALLLNPTAYDIDFQLPDAGAAHTWQVEFSTDSALPSTLNECQLRLSMRCVALLSLIEGDTCN
jgi:glycogen operon protein